MSNRMRKITCFGMGALLALTAGAPPVMADDTELMLMLPEIAARPNILFMLDTSGSMDDEVLTKRPYDPGEIYSGSCESSSVYWTEVNVTPNCASAQQIPDSAFKCNAANGQLMGIGSYTDTMVQRREIPDGTAFRWQELEAGNGVDTVECMADSGEHGAGVAGDVYATNDASSSSGFTNDPDQELSWGSAPATVSYTVYDGNYLNWKSMPPPQAVDCSGSNPPADCVRKIDILKAVTTAVLNSISDVNVGIMRFNDNNGGLIIQAMSDLDANRQDILDEVDNLPAQGSTPLAEVMYEGAQYWRGGAPYFGLGHTATDPNALGTTGNYLAPGTQQCSKNFNILLSDGQPQDGNDEAPGLAADNLPGFGGCDGGTGTGACLDDIAGYLASVDIDGDADNGNQLVTTHTIGFSMDIPTLQQTATDSGGRYFRADDVETLTSALLNIFSDITKRSLSFTAPAISVNSFNRTQNLNDLYITVFEAQNNVHWPGNLKKYRVAPINGQMQIVDANGQAAVEPGTGFFRDSAQSLWTDTGPDGADVPAGGAAHELSASRTLYTDSGTGGALELISTSNFTDTDDALFGLTGAAGEPTVADLIDWMNGRDVLDDDLDNDTTDARNAMGDPLHSQPAAVVYGGTQANPEVVVFTGTNDGYLHAFDGETGQELWAFVPMELLDDMNRLFFDPASNFKHYGIDGSIVPVVFDADNDGVIESGDHDFVYLVFGLRRGGSSYYALDVTNKTSPELLWLRQVSGQSWSTPVIARVDPGDDTDDPNKDLRVRDAVVIVGGGYDPVHDTPAAPAGDDALGNGIYILDLETGAPVWSAGPSSSSTANLKHSQMTRAFPSQVRVIDMSGDGFADRMYAADVGGRIWRFDIANGQPANSLVAGGIIADFGTPGVSEAAAAIPRRFYNAPDVAIFNDPNQGRRLLSISIGSGYRAHPLNEDANDMFFSLRDPAVFNQLTQTAYNGYDVATVDDLVDVAPDSTATTIDPQKRGWKFALPDAQGVLADSVTFDDAVLFVAFSPDANTNNPCQPSAGRNFAYQVDVVNGDFARNNLDSPVDDENTENVTEIAQGGIAPSPSILFPGATDAACEGAECSVPPIFCVGAECFQSGFRNDPVRTLWTQDGIE